jgi:hypothetical protein
MSGAHSKRRVQHHPHAKKRLVASALGKPERLGRLPTSDGFGSVVGVAGATAAAAAVGVFGEAVIGGGGASEYVELIAAGAALSKTALSALASAAPDAQ